MSPRGGRVLSARAGILPGTIIYAGLGWLFLTDKFPVLVGLPAALLAGASLYAVQPSIRRYSEVIQRKPKAAVAFSPGFYRYYLSGTWLVLAYMYNYLAVALALGGWLFLIIAAFA
jgi:hypothetical protein